MQTGQKKRPVVALTGASSHIGSHLLDKLKGRFDIIALSHSADKRESTEHVTWRSCDLFSQIDTEKGLYGADIAVYLVHSMRPSAKLTQARDEDMDVILADNFAQAAKKNGVKQIIYLSGIIPPEEKRSRHLRTKSEAEKILGSYGVSVTTVRTGLIVGSIGASAEKSDKQLPVILSSWTRHCQKTKLPSRQDVRSIQRMPLPDAKDANWAARHYMSWLSDSLRPFVRTAIDEHLNCKIYLTVTKKPLLILSYAKKRSTPHRALYYITGGLFANTKESQSGRIEFRNIPGKQEMIIAIHEYVPSLPWTVYKYTQAPIHMLVMYLYKKHLERLIDQKQSDYHAPQHAIQH